MGFFLLLLVPTVALAAPGHGRGHWRRYWAPEFGTAAAGTIAALVAGGAVVLARRRRRR